MKNGYRITDSHAHIFPDKIAEKATNGISTFYHLPMEYHGRVSEMLENGRAAGVDRFLICSPATTVTQVHSINAFLASCEAAYPMCTAFGTLHPASENLEEDFEQLQKLHLHGVKLHPDFQRFPIDDPAAYPMYDKEGKALTLEVKNYGLSSSAPSQIVVEAGGRKLAEGQIAPLAPYATAALRLDSDFVPTEKELSDLTVTFYTDGKETGRNKLNY